MRSAGCVRARVAPVMAFAIFGAAVLGGGEPAVEAAEKPARIPVILDTDIGDDIDDAFALALALQSPELDILGVTLWQPTPLESTVCAAAGDQSQSAVFAGFYAWADARSGESDVYGADLWYGHGEIPVCTAAGRQESPSVSYRWRPGDTGAYDLLVVWQDDRSGSWDIYGALVDPVTYAVTEFPVCTAAGDQLHPTTDGESVVWEDRRGGDWDVYRYDLTEHKEYLLSLGPADQRFPFISGERVVWQDDRRSDWDVWVYDVVDFGWRPSRTPLPLVVRPGNQTNPQTGSDSYVWEDDRNVANGTGSDIYGMVLDWALEDMVLREVPVCVAPGDQTDPAMSGTYVAWQDTRDGGSDIYGAQITEWNCDLVINGGAAWTRSTAVIVLAKGRWGGERAGYVSLSNDEDLWSLWLAAWQPLRWTLAAGDDGPRTVAAQFYDGDISPSVYGTITLDRHGPTTTATPVAMRRGAVVRLPYGVTDNLSPKARVRIRIRDAHGAVAARIVVGLVKTSATRTVSWRCALAPGRYTWEVLATDLAGNRQQVTGRAALIVR